MPAAQPWDSGGGGDKPTVPKAPDNYAPLTPDQRQQWNDFLDFVGKQGLGGSAKLDARDQKLGLGLLQQYKKANPNFAITPQMIPNIQYDQWQLRKGDSFPGLTPEQLKYVRSGLNPAYMQRPVSDTDGWLGSLTSKQYYPTATGGTSQGQHYDFGVNIEDYAKSAGNPDLRQKYLVKQ